MTPGRPELNEGKGSKKDLQKFLIVSVRSFLDCVQIPL